MARGAAAGPGERAEAGGTEAQAQLDLLSGLGDLVRLEGPRRRRRRRESARRDSSAPLASAAASAAQRPRPRAHSETDQRWETDERQERRTWRTKESPKERRPSGPDAAKRAGGRGSMDTPMRAIACGDKDGLQTWLLTRGIPNGAINDVHPRTGRSMLHEACLEGENEAIVRLLLSCRGIEVDKRTVLGKCTALMLASRGGHNNLVRVLVLHAHADVHARNSRGEAAIHLVADPFAAQTLINAGANPFVKTCAGQSASQCAAMREDAAVYEILERHAQMRLRQGMAQRKAANARRKTREETADRLRRDTERNNLVRGYQQWRSGRGVSLAK